MSFSITLPVRFADVDPAGIVFYPRYFEMVNALVEDWFAAKLGLDFRTMHLERGIGVPTVRLEADFLAPSRLGDELTLALDVVELGNSSCRLAINVMGGEQTRLKVTVVIVAMDLSGQRAIPWPASVRQAMLAA